MFIDKFSQKQLNKILNTEKDKAGWGQIIAFYQSCL